MAIDQEVLLLQQSPIFQNVEPAKLRLLAVSSDHVMFEPGERILVRGEESDEIFFILTGQAETEEGYAVSHVIGHIGTLLRRPRPRTIIAKSRIEALRLDREAFVNLLQHCGAFSLAMLIELARLSDNLLKVVERRQSEPA